MAEVNFKKPQVDIDYLSSSKVWAVKVNNTFYTCERSLMDLLDRLVKDTVISEGDRTLIIREFETETSRGVIF